MMAETTPKQEKFIQVYIETGNGSEAYRRAYDTSNWKPQAIAVQACKMLSNPKIVLRLTELNNAQVERHQFTVDDMVDQLDQDRAFARENTSPSAAVAASMGKAKMLGHFGGKGDKNQAPTLADISIEEAQNMLIDRITVAWTALQAKRAKALTAPDN